MHAHARLIQIRVRVLLFHRPLSLRESPHFIISECKTLRGEPERIHTGYQQRILRMSVLVLGVQVNNV